MTLWIYVVVFASAIVVLMTVFVLLASSGDGRPPLERLKHPTKVGLQEEFGGDGNGHVRKLTGYEALRTIAWRERYKARNVKR